LRYPVHYGKEKVLKTERGSTRSTSVENSLWKWLWSCWKTDFGMNEWVNKFTT